MKLVDRVQDQACRAIVMIAAAFIKRIMADRIISIFKIELVRMIVTIFLLLSLMPGRIGIRLDVIRHHALLLLRVSKNKEKGRFFITNFVGGGEGKLVW